MRVTPNTTAMNSLYYIERTRSNMDDLQEKIASYNNYNRPSDDPVAARLLMGLNERLTTEGQYTSNINKANLWFSTADAAFTSMYDVLADLRHQLSQVSSSITDPAVRNTAINNLKMAKQSLVDLGNTDINGVYIFAGSQNLSPPFTGATSTYNGNSSDIKVNINKGMSEAMNIPGDQFLTSTGGPYGSVNILTTIDQLITDIGASNAAGVDTGLQALDDGSKQLMSAQVTLESRMTRLENAQTMHTNITGTLQLVMSNTQVADIAKLGVELQQQQTAFQATLSATAKISQMSLLNYL